MKRILAIAALLVAITLPALAQWRRLSSDDQQRFDSYYSRWLDYRRTNNRGEVASMEKRMQDIYRDYGIPSGTPYSRIASNDGRDDRWGRDRDGWRDDNRWNGRLSADDQRRFDDYYARWIRYKETNNHDEIISMERRMLDIYERYRIPTSVPFRRIASNDNRWDRDRDRWGRDRDHDGWRDDVRWDRGDRWRGHLSADDQRRFDSYYSRWLNYKRTNNRDEITSMEKRMLDLYAQYNIPRSIPYGAVASQGQGY